MKKNSMAEGLLEALLEIVVSLICFGIGAFIVSLLGVNLDWASMDGDLMMLLGLLVIAAPIAFFLLICALVHWLKKTVKNKSARKRSAFYE